MGRLVCVLFALLLLNGCVTESWCVHNSRIIYNRGERWGYKMRMVTGRTQDGTLHRWAEYFNTKRNKWCVWETNKSYYTAKEWGYKEVIKID